MFGARNFVDSIEKEIDVFALGQGVTRPGVSKLQPAGQRHLVNNKNIIYGRTRLIRHRLIRQFA